MSLPRIVNPTPTVKPAVPEKSFPDIFIREIVVTCDPSGPWRANIMIQPYNYDTGEVDDSVNPNYVNIEDLKTESLTNENLATLMALLLQTIEGYIGTAS